MSLTPLTLFNQVEEKLREMAESIQNVAQVSVAETESFQSPRVFVWIREGRSEDTGISGFKRLHIWRFEYVVDVVHPDPAAAYQEVKRIHWELYQRLMEDRTLGGLVSSLQPASYFRREELQPTQGYGHRWVMQVDVSVEV